MEIQSFLCCSVLSFLRDLRRSTFAPDPECYEPCRQTQPGSARRGSGEFARTSAGRFALWRSVSDTLGVSGPLSQPSLSSEGAIHHSKSLVVEWPTGAATDRTPSLHDDAPPR